LHTWLKDHQPKQVIATLVESKNVYVFITKAIGCMAPLVKTSTFDNSKEFAEHAELATQSKRKLHWSIATIHP
jgi:IS30 family transposase